VGYQLPADEGDAPVTGYHVQRRLVGDKSRWETVNAKPITAMEFVVDQLKPRSEYQFRVAAENGRGRGDYSEPSQSMECPPDIEAERYPVGALQRYCIVLYCGKRTYTIRIKHNEDQ